MTKIDTKLSDQISIVLSLLGVGRVDSDSTITLNINTGSFSETKKIKLRLVRDMSDPIGGWEMVSP